MRRDNVQTVDVMTMFCQQNIRAPKRRPSNVTQKTALFLLNVMQLWVQTLAQAV